MKKKENSGKTDVKSKIELLIREILFLRKENRLLREQIDLYNYRMKDLDNYYELLKSGNDNLIKSIPESKSVIGDKAAVGGKNNMGIPGNPDINNDRLEMLDSIEDAEFEKDFSEEMNYASIDYVPDNLTAAVNTSVKSGESVIQENIKEIESPEVESIHARFIDLNTNKDKDNKKYDEELNLKDIEEKIRMSLRKKYNRNIIRRWIIELMMFNSKPKIRTEELVNELKIPLITLKRDIKFFKSKGWIEFIGQRKFGFYSITEEGRIILKKDRTK